MVSTPFVVIAAVTLFSPALAASNHLPTATNHFLNAAAAATSAPATTSAAVAAAAAASTSPLPLTDYTYSYDQIPYQVNPYAVGRGPQSGFNECNSTTGGATSQCQTLVMNNASDWCIWGSPTTGATGTIGDIEAAVVAYCTKDGHGARVIPAGAVTGLQFMRTSAYIQITGHIDLTGINLVANDTGGELDPHGADLLGNPLGGLVYSTGLLGGNNNTYQQASEWNNFVGGGTFCLKLCDPSVTSPNYCQNTFDLIGCSYNMPAAYIDKEFTSCEGELQDVAGTYTGTDGKLTTWSQPATLPATSTLPWTPRIPSSSNCVTYQSSELFAGATTTSAAIGGSSSATSTAKSSTSTSVGTDGKSTPVAVATKSGTAGAAASGTTSGASSVVGSSVGVLTVLGGFFALLA